MTVINFNVSGVTAIASVMGMFAGMFLHVAGINLKEIGLNLFIKLHGFLFFQKTIFHQTLKIPDRVVEQNLADLVRHGEFHIALVKLQQVSFGHGHPGPDS